MPTQIYKIETSEGSNLLLFKNFIEKHVPQPVYVETYENGFAVFELNFNNEFEKEAFYADFRKFLEP
jgi:hypothetical protein